MIKQGNKKTNSLIDEFLGDMSLDSELNGTSLPKYRWLLEKMLGEILEKESHSLGQCDFESLTTETVKKFLADKQKAGRSPRTIRGYLFAFKKFIAYLKDTKKFNLRIKFEELPRIKEKSKREVVYLTEEEIGRFFNAVLTNTKNKNKVAVCRFTALCYFLLETGARISEALSIEKADVDWERREVVIVGKGNKQRTLFFRGKSKYWLEKYLSMRLGNDCEYLFATITGEARWEPSNVDGLFREYAKLAGIKKRITAHVLRHTMATQLMAKGVELNTISFLLGHADTITTLKYYIGAVEKEKIRKGINDGYFDFISEVDIPRNDFWN